MLKSIGMNYVDAFVVGFNKELKDTKVRLVYYYFAILNLAFSYESHHQILVDEILELRRFLEKLGIENYKDYYKQLFDYTKKQYDMHNMQTELFVESQQYLQKAELLAEKRKENAFKPVHILEVMATDNVVWMWPNYFSKLNQMKIVASNIKNLYLDIYDEDMKHSGQIQVKANAFAFTIGKGNECDLQLFKQNNSLSNCHTKITCFNGNYYIEDLNSENGTYVNDVLIGSKTTPKKYVCLSHGDIVMLGTNIWMSVSLFNDTNIKKKTCILCQREFITEEDVELCPMCFYKFKKDLMQVSSIQEVKEIPSDFNLVSYPIKQFKIISNNQEKLELMHNNKKGMIHSEDIIPGYEIIKVIGEGSICNTYLVKQRLTGKQMALKITKEDQIITPLMKEKYEHEAYIQQQMNHKYMIKHYNHGEYNGRLYLLMEYYEHGTVLDYMNKIKNYDLLKELLIQVLQGLDYLHHASVKVKDSNDEFIIKEGIVHGNIKPQNIFVDYDTKGNMMIKIADFAFTKAFENHITDISFMPRQQLLGSKKESAQVDIWAAVAVIYFLGTGKFPKPIQNQEDKLQIYLEEKTVPIKQQNWLFPSKFAKVIDRALDDEAENLYYQEASDLIIELLKL